MGTYLNYKRKEKLLKRFPNCFYCKAPMVLHRLKSGENTPMNYATWEHLNQMYDHPNGRPVRGRIVLACRRCNEERSNQTQASLPKEELWKRSGRKPLELRAEL